MTINYSIIIPHKDIPNLLQRCLDSIPVRNDVEVIVVDDNSDPRKVDFEHFPKWNGGHFQVFQTKEGKGAGFARNVGLNHAQGQWIVFADADDFFTEDFGSLLDEMMDAEADVVFFNYICVMSDDVTKQVETRTWFRKLISDFLDGKGSESKFRKFFPMPWCKLVKKKLIEQYHIRFSEVKWGNDEFFSAQIGRFAKEIRVSGRIGYVLTLREGSLTYDFCATAKEFRIRLTEILKCDDLFQDFYGCKARSKGWLEDVYRKKGFGNCAWFCLANVFYPRIFRTTAVFLFKKIKIR
jgi:glycosyltransferase involved in cell wall biosynthesis